MWVHSQPAILLNNRTSHKEPEVPEGEDIEPEELLKRIEAADPYEARLKPVTLDKPVSVSKHSKTSSWVVRMMGDSSEYKDSAGRVESNGVVVARSLQWPGAFNFYSKGRYFFFYVGDGLKYEDKQFFPVSPPTMMGDPEEHPVEAEPNPSDEELERQRQKEAEEAAAAKEGNADE
jgi:hypothetical protein